MSDFYNVSALVRSKDGIEGTYGIKIKEKDSEIIPESEIKLQFLYAAYRAGYEVIDNEIKIELE
jgi:hypothetical protein